MSAAYPPGDPRATLATAGAPTSSGPTLPMQYFDFGALEPDVLSAAGSRSWIVRAQNVVLVLTELAAGDTLERDDVDETMVVLTRADAPVRIDAGGATAMLEPTAIAVIPPGPSTLTAAGDARVLRLFSTSATDLVAASRNREQYAPTPTSIAVHAPWPAPAGGAALRVYPDLESIAASPDRMGRIFRNRHAMVNVLYPRVGPRDPGSLSPHDHADFEQLSFVDEGTYVHHIRHPWGKDRREWIDDEHREIGAPSLAIIAPPLIHTSEAVGPDTNQMIDIFAGPRADFSAKPGWVLNADDYPVASA